MNPIFPTSPLFDQQQAGARLFRKRSWRKSIWQHFSDCVNSGCKCIEWAKVKVGQKRATGAVLTVDKLSPVNNQFVLSRQSLAHRTLTPTLFGDKISRLPPHPDYSQALPHYGQPYYFVPCSQKSACHPFITEVTFPLKTSGDWHPLQLLKNG